MKLKVHKG